MPARKAASALASIAEGGWPVCVADVAADGWAGRVPCALVLLPLLVQAVTEASAATATSMTQRGR